MIELKQLNKNYYFNKHAYQALKDINLTVRQGEVFGVLGKSGAGKSTLLRCINLLEKPDSGQVIVNGVNLASLPFAELRKHRHKIGIIFQHFNLLESRTVFDNIALPLEIQGRPKYEIHSKVSHLLELVELSDKKYHLPSQLSGGQKQRTAIARALAAGPHVLLSDEATSALDPQSTQSILDLLQKINRELGLTILLITHELAVVKQICTHVGILEQGQLIEQGLTIDLLTNPQTTITKQLVQQKVHSSIPIKKHNTLLVRLTFASQNSDEPLITTLIRNFAITINIKQAQIEKIQNTTIGFAVCELTGQLTVLKEVLHYLQSTSIKAEVINHE